MCLFSYSNVPIFFFVVEVRWGGGGGEGVPIPPDSQDVSSVTLKLTLFQFFNFHHLRVGSFGKKWMHLWLSDLL